MSRAYNLRSRQPVAYIYAPSTRSTRSSTKKSATAEREPTEIFRRRITKRKRSDKSDESEVSAEVEESSVSAAPSGKDEKTRSAPAKAPKPSSKAKSKAKRTSKGKAKKAKTAPKHEDEKAADSKAEKSLSSESKSVIKINRAPVLTLWTAVVASCRGYEWDTALTLGKTIAGWFAYSKGKSLGLYKESEKTKEERARERGQHEDIKILERKVPCRSKGPGTPPLALAKGKPITPESVESYLVKAFGGEDNLSAAKQAMNELAESVKAKARSSGAESAEDELDKQAYDLYTSIRPQVPAGTGGWGKKGLLDLALIQSMANSNE